MQGWSKDMQAGLPEEEEMTGAGGAGSRLGGQGPRLLGPPHSRMAL